MRILRYHVILWVLLAVLVALPAWAGAETGGTCGDNLTWVLDDSGTLTISGEGKIDDYERSGGPWGSDVREIVMNEGITRIGDYAFKNCSGLTSITIPDGVVSIGKYAFFNCSDMNSISVPDSVASIGDSAFAGCHFKEVHIASIGSWVKISFGNRSSNPMFNDADNAMDINDAFANVYVDGELLTHAVIPEGIASIGSYSFICCSSLVSITIPESVTSIGANAFTWCQPGEIHVSSLASWLRLNMNNAGYEGAYSLYIDGVLLTDVVIPAGCTSIEHAAFSCCTSLKSVTIPEGVTSIGVRAFEGCTNLTGVDIPDSVTSIESYAFQGCAGLTGVDIPGSVTSIGSAAFANCTGLTDLILPDSITNIDSYSFSGCTGLRGITIPDSVTGISANAFAGCTSLRGITIPDSVTRIGWYAFYGCTGLTGIALPEGITAIDIGVFIGCTGLSEIYIPTGVTSIGDRAFRDCTGLARVIIPGAERPAYTLDIPSDFTVCCRKNSGVATWAAENGYHVSDLDDLTTLIKLSVTAPSTGMEKGDAHTLTVTRVPEITNPAIVWTSSDPGIASVVDGVVVARAPGMVTITAACGEVSDSCVITVGDAPTFTLPTGLTTLGAEALADTGAKVYVLPQGMTGIADRAFAGCANMACVVIPGSVNSIADTAFAGCGNFIIIAPEGSCAHAFALEKGISWVDE